MGTIMGHVGAVGEPMTLQNPPQSAFPMAWAANPDGIVAPEALGLNAAPGHVGNRGHQAGGRAPLNSAASKRIRLSCGSRLSPSGADDGTMASCAAAGVTEK